MFTPPHPTPLSQKTRDLRGPLSLGRSLNPLRSPLNPWGLIFCLAFGMVFFKSLHELQAQTYRVVIDPGHGGKDQGSVHGTLHEAQLNLTIALSLFRQLEKEKEIHPFLTRKENKDVSLKERIQFVYQSKAHFLISLHVNSLPQAHSKAKGMEIYIASPPILKKQQISFLSPHNLHQLHIPSVSLPLAPPISPSLHPSPNSSENPSENVSGNVSENLPRNPSGNPSTPPSKISLHQSRPNFPQSQSLKHILQDLQVERRFLYSIQLSKSLYEQWNPAKRPIRQAPFFILTQSPVPAVLIEMGFLSNSEERNRLQQKDYQEEIATQIYRGILEFKKILDKG